MLVCVVECAQAFHAAGARLVLCGRDAARLQQVVQELAAGSTDTQRQVGPRASSQSQMMKNDGIQS